MKSCICSRLSSATILLALYTLLKLSHSNDEFNSGSGLGTGNNSTIIIESTAFYLTDTMLPTQTVFPTTFSTPTAKPITDNIITIIIAIIGGVVLAAIIIPVIIYLFWKKQVKKSLTIQITATPNQVDLLTQEAMPESEAYFKKLDYTRQVAIN